MDKNTEDRIKSVMAVIFDIDAKNIDDDASPDNIESWDSLSSMNLIIALEEEFNIKLTDEETLNMLNFKLIRQI